MYPYKDKFHKLERNVVYIRRRSATDIANPDEIARMGQMQVHESLIPALTLEFIDPQSRKFCGAELRLQSKPSIVRDRNTLPDYPKARQTEREPHRTAYEAMGLYESHRTSWNKEYYREFSSYLFDTTAFQEVRVRIINSGGIILNNVHIEFWIPKPSNTIFLRNAEPIVTPTKKDE